MSSHREAPSIKDDPTADNTDVYAFVSPDNPDTVTLIANFIPLEEPNGGPNFYEFSENVLYEIKVDNNGDGIADIKYEFRFHSEFQNPNTFLYNVGPISSLDDPNWNYRQTYTITRVKGDDRRVVAENLLTPPCRIGPRSTPDYESLANAAIHSMGGYKVFAGQRDDGFFVDLGSIFDLATLRPFQHLHLIPSAAAMGVDGLGGFNVHTIAIQVPKTELTRDGSMPTDPESPDSVIGVYATASRQRVTQIESGVSAGVGPWAQVSRLANPLVNEVIIPLGKKDRWNASDPSHDEEFVEHYTTPELAQLLPALYPGVFPNLQALNESGAERTDLVLILLRGLPAGVIPGFQNTTGDTLADLMRLNMAIPPSAEPNPLGLIAGDPAGYPNGRRVFDDTVAISLRVVAGALYNLVDSEYTPDPAATQLTDGTTNAKGYLSTFPYLAHPHEGYAHEHHENVVA